MVFQWECVWSLGHRVTETCINVHSNEFSVTNVLTTGRKGCLILVEKLAKRFVSFIRNVTLRQHALPYIFNITR